MLDAVDSTPVASLAAWDGETWTSLDGRVTEGHFFERVPSLAVYQGQLIVGGQLTDGPTGYGSMLSGAETGTLTITDIHAPDGAIYVCLAENGCESAPSDEARLIVCVADDNCDGSVNTIDVLAFLNVWNAEC